MAHASANNPNATVRSTARAEQALALQPTVTQSVYDRVGRNALTHGPIRTYPIKPTRLQLIARFIVGAL